MHRRVLKRLVAVAGEKGRSFLSSMVIGLGIWVGFPTVVAYQDMTSLVSGLEAPNARWNAYVEKSVAGSVHAAEMPFVDSDTTGSISGFRRPAARHRRRVVSRQRQRGQHDARRRPHHARRQEGPHRQRLAGRAAEELQCRLGVRAHLLAASPEHGQRTEMAFAKPEIKGKEIADRRRVSYPRRQEAGSRRAGHARRARQQRQARRPGHRLCAGRA